MMDDVLDPRESHAHDAESHDTPPDDPEPFEAYCVRCRDTVWLDEPIPVWTRKGQPATRGDCPTCGSTVFRLGWTPAHERKSRPAPVNVGETKRTKLPKTAVYLAYAPADEELAGQVAADLEKMGFALWMHQTEPDDGIAWAGGVHPSLRECSQMIVLLSPGALAETSVSEAWRFFREKNKPIIVAVAAAAEVPDPLRRRPRFDLAGDYKGAFRQMLSALNE
ncbi:MAG: TIR domain-containing protein [bacterium]|nr:TIR domain-containing protein [bacterium]